MFKSKKSITRALVLALAVTTVLAFTPAIAWPQEAHAVPAPVTTTVNGVNVSYGGYWKWDASSKTYISSTSSNYNVRYDPENFTLELKNDNHFTSVTSNYTRKIAINLDNVEINAGEGTAIKAEDTPVTLTLTGTNKITTASLSADYCGIVSAKGENETGNDIKVQGSGSLDISSGGCAISAYNLLSIQSGTINADSKASDALFGCDVIISGGNTTATSTDDAGILGEEALNISGGTVIAAGNHGSGLANSMEGAISVTGGAVYAYGSYYAMHTSSDVSLDSGGKLPEITLDSQYITILSNAAGESTLAYASDSTSPASDLSVGGIKFATDSSTNLNLSTKAYGDYSDNAAADGSHAHSWSACKTGAGYSLTLNDALITADKIHCSNDLTVNLSGANTIDLRSLAAGVDTASIDCSKSLTFKGSGELLATANKATASSSGICALGIISISEGKISAAGGTAPKSYGIYSGAGLAVSGPCTLISESANATAFYSVPSISKLMAAVVKAGSEAGGTNAAVVNSPANTIYTNSKYIEITTTAKPIPANGKTYTADKARYTVTNASTNGAGTVTLASPTSKKLKSIAVGSTVNIGGFTYKITAIGAGAFKKNSRLKKITIGKNVKSIGKNAFYGDKKLKTITVKSKVLKTVGKNAIKGISKKAVIKVPKSKFKACKKMFSKKTGFKKPMKIKK